MTEQQSIIIRNYIFENYVLRSDGILMYKSTKIHIPPKELDVFMLLLEASGQLVTKESIFSKVWREHAASDESLTRCIYVLRQLLCENKKNRYIETIYGKGYRFKPEVSVVTHPVPIWDNQPLAVFPFRTNSEINETLLHHQLIQNLSRQQGLHVNVMPAVVTQDCKCFTAINALINQLHPEYYITGKIITEGSLHRFFIETIHASTHKLIDNQSMDILLNTGLPNYATGVINVLTEKIIHIVSNKLSTVSEQYNGYYESVFFD